MRKKTLIHTQVIAFIKQQTSGKSGCRLTISDIVEKYAELHGYSIDNEEAQLGLGSVTYTRLKNGTRAIIRTHNDSVRDIHQVKQETIGSKSDILYWID